MQAFKSVLPSGRGFARDKYLLDERRRKELFKKPIKNSLRFERWKKCVFSSLQFKGREYFSLLLYLASLGVTMERIKTINLTSYQSCNKI